MVWTKGRQLAAMSDTQTTLSFKYDSSGIRTKKRVNGVETYYTYVGSTLVSQKTGDEVINFAYTAGGAPYGFTYNGQSYFYLLNLQGDIVGIYDNTGTVVVRYVYDAWGKLISITGDLADTVGVKNPLRYRGYYYDTETGWYYLQSRYYDPEICRFINADAYLIAGDDYIQGTNMFAYCYNNPVMYNDPSGMACVCITNRVGPRHVCNDPNNTHIIDTSRFERKQVNQGSVSDVVGYSSDAMGILGTGLEVVAANSSKLTNVGGGIWEMQTTMPKVTSVGKGIGMITTGIGAVLTGSEIYDLLANRDDLSTNQKVAGTAIEIGEFGASVGVGALASKVGTVAATASLSHPLLAAGVAVVGISVVGGIIIYSTANYFSEKVGI